MIDRNNIKYRAVWFLIETWLDVVTEWNRVYLWSYFECARSHLILETNRVGPG